MPHDHEPMNPHPFIGRHVIARCGGAGVHAGVLRAVDGDRVILADARRLWRWRARKGLALSGVAMHGIDADDSKLDTRVPEIYLTGVLELIPTSASAKESIDAA